MPLAPELADAPPPRGDAACGGAAEWLRWRLNRLRCMTPAEVLHRAARLAAAQAERAGWLGAGAEPAPDRLAPLRPWVHAAPGVDPAPYFAAADRIVAGELEVFSARISNPGAPPQWNRDPKTGTEAPPRFGKLLDYRDPRLVGDIKYLWELNRHLHLVTLAQAYALSGEPRYLATIQLHLESWFDACPRGVGPNWSSALEAAIRLINWSITWQLIGGGNSAVFSGAEGSRFRERWMRSVYQHARFVRGFLSRHSSANNHLIGEAAGLYLAALTWPCWPKLRAWRRAAKAILESEALLQNAADGVNREQAVCYQQFVLDFLLLCDVAGRANGEYFSIAYEWRIDSMLDFLASITDAGGHVPMIGDGDEGTVARFSREAGFCPYRSLLATGAVLFGSGEFKRKAAVLDDKTRWLFGARAGELFERIRAEQTQLPPERSFPEGGYYVLGCDFETPEEIRLVADAGPLGYRAIAAHGHADALAFTLSVGGMEFLIDPGTYAYHGRSPWRDYFRGTAAHNTVRVDGLDQSRAGGNFMWLEKANAGCSLWDADAERDLFEGWHDGYSRLRDPVTHRRRIALDKEAKSVVIEDRLEMKQAHDIELFFHCSENCSVNALRDGYAIAQEGRTLLLTPPRLVSATSRVYRGSTAPICGWVSRQFDRKRPAPTICWRARIAGHCVLRTRIDCDL
ncbi:MAG TPA: alginate lyase family protein [Burkholderiales bacterium]|nr:alginate lyase family protein [Burkholderiales bacterium]